MITLNFSTCWVVLLESGMLPLGILNTDVTLGSPFTCSGRFSSSLFYFGFPDSSILYYPLFFACFLLHFVEAYLPLYFKKVYCGITHRIRCWNLVYILLNFHTLHVCNYQPDSDIKHFLNPEVSFVFCLVNILSHQR